MPFLKIHYSNLHLIIQNSSGMKNKPFLKNCGRFPEIRSSRRYHDQTSHFENEIGFFQEPWLKNHLRVCYLGFYRSGGIFFIKSAILITTGIVRLDSSGKLKEPISPDKITSTAGNTATSFNYSPVKVILLSVFSGTFRSSNLPSSVHVISHALQPV